jgi:hypothetical protein
VTEPATLIAGRYLLVERIGTGAMGVVWRARDQRLGRTVALKQLAPSAGAAAGEGAERIMREGRIAARLHHPNAISVFDVTDHGGTPWLVMEYLPSNSLAAVLAEHGPLPPREVAVVGLQLAGALVAAHAAGIVHRDIKPGNVLLGDGVVKLTDFGISRAIGDVTVTRTGLLSGTPAYLAPEVARGAAPNPASDVFGLGATLYAAVEGQPPFGTHDNPLALLHQVAGGQVLPPRQAGPLTALLMQLLRPDPAQRPTMAEAHTALAAVADGRPAPTGAAPGGVATIGCGPPVSGLAPAGSGTGVVTGGASFGDGTTVALAGAAPGAFGGSAALETMALTGSGQQFAPHTVMELPLGGDEQGPQERGRRPALIIAIGVALAVLTGLLVLAATTGSDRPIARAVTPGQPSLTTTLASTTPPPTTTAALVTAADLQRAVAEYYALLPGHPDQAWTRLGPSLQAKGIDGYQDFWHQVRSLQAAVSKVDAAAMTVRVFLVYRRDDRRPQGEVRELVLVRSGDALLIDGDTRIGATPAAPTTTRKHRG